MSALAEIKGLERTCEGDLSDAQPLLHSVNYFWVKSNVVRYFVLLLPRQDL